MKSINEKFIKRKIQNLDKALVSIIDLTETELEIHRAISGHMKRIRKILKEILEETKWLNSESNLSMKSL